MSDFNDVMAQYTKKTAQATLKAIVSGDFNPEMQVSQLIFYLRRPESSHFLNFKYYLKNLEKITHIVPLILPDNEKEEEFRRLVGHTRKLMEAMDMVIFFGYDKTKKFVELYESTKKPEEIIQFLVDNVTSLKDGTNGILESLKTKDYVDKKFIEIRDPLLGLCSELVLCQMLYMAILSPDLRKHGGLYLSKGEMEAMDKLLKLANNLKEGLDETNKKRLDDFFPDVPLKYLKKHLADEYDGKRNAEDWVVSQLKRDFSAWEFLIISWNDIDRINRDNVHHTWKHDIKGLKFHEYTAGSNGNWVNSTHYLIIRLPLDALLDRRDALVNLSNKIEENLIFVKASERDWNEMAADKACEHLSNGKEEPSFSMVLSFNREPKFGEDKVDRINLNIKSSSPCSFATHTFNSRYDFWIQSIAHHICNTQRVAIVSNHFAESKN